MSKQRKMPMVLLLIGLSWNPSAYADDAYIHCIEASNGSNSEWAICGGALVQREDARLNAVWKRVFTPLTGQTRKDLLVEQRAWIAFREKACRYYDNGEWGREGQVMHYPTCIAALIASRTGYLEALGDEP